MKRVLEQTRKLNNGVRIPLFGLGTWQMSGEEAYRSVLWALEAGYRHIDTAAFYGNEREIGEAIRASTVPRKNIFVTTKLWSSGQHDPLRAFYESLERLGFEYVDLYLIHWPFAQRITAWKELESLLSTKKVRALGVSNFTIRHLQELLKTATVVPTVNQVEFTPYLYQKELLYFCESKGIVLEAYSPLTQGNKLNDPQLVKIAQKYNKNPAHILLCWSVQHGLVVIPKSTHKERIIENANVDFEISAVDMKKLDGFNENLRYCFDPEKII